MICRSGVCFCQTLMTRRDLLNSLHILTCSCTSLQGYLSLRLSTVKRKPSLDVVFGQNDLQSDPYFILKIESMDLQTYALIM